jgi:transposase
MFIKRTRRTVRGRTYVNHLLVESSATPKGPRHRVICSLGSLAPAPREQWRALAHKIESALSGQGNLDQESQVNQIVARVRGGAIEPTTLARRRKRSLGSDSRSAGHEANGELLTIHVDRVDTEQHREVGPVHVGHEMWKKLGVDHVLGEAGLSSRTVMLTKVMTLNRLIHPCSEHAMPDWIRRTALEDILGESFVTLADDALYRNLDRLHPQREKIERGLGEREKTLFNLDDTFFLYDLTSTYFEGQCPLNPQAKRGYSRDKRPDCKQVVVGLVLNTDGFPKAHEVFEGSLQDRQSVKEMLDRLESRVGKKKPGTTVVVDRGMAFDDNLTEIGKRGYHYLVASRQGERNEHFEEFEEKEGWQEVIRKPSPRNPAQKKSKVFIKHASSGEEVHILCWSEGRVEKDRAIRESHEARLLRDLKKLRKRINKGHLIKTEKIHQAIGRLQERYPRVARYYEISYQGKEQRLSWKENAQRKERAKRLDGTYLFKTDRQDLGDEEIWRTYMLLTRVEAAFRAMKSPLAERPIFHHLEHRVQTHIFLCVLAYHLLVSIEKMFLDAGIHTSWATIREQLATRQVSTVVLPVSNGEVLRIRKASTPEPTHRQIYETLQIPPQVMKPIKTWHAE